jgi:hypothetical protein
MPQALHYKNISSQIYNRQEDVLKYKFNYFFSLANFFHRTQSCMAVHNRLFDLHITGFSNKLTWALFSFS